MYNFISFIILISFLLIAIPIIIIGKLKVGVFLFTVSTLLIIYFLFRILRLRIFRSFRSELEHLEEKSNLLLEDLKEKQKILDFLPLRAKKITSLFNVSCDLIELIEPEAISDFLVKTCSELFPSADSIMLFMLQNDSLCLNRSLKRKDILISEKHGDVIEKWVIKHTQSLAIEDITKDFRFDYNKVTAFKERKMRCFIVSPLVIGETILGSMRVESKNPSLFLLDDSRLLRSVCDLGALVLERAHFFKKAEESAIRDSLTSLFLRNYFFRRLKEEVKRAAMAKTSLGLIMLDIDDFKKINDSYGHTVGDLVIKKLAQILLDTAGNTANLICRFGGEEFMVCLVDCNRDRLHDTAEKIRSLAAETVVNFRRKEIRFTVSLGGVLYPDDSQDVLDLAGISDQLLYKAKKEGKNKACYLG